MIRTGDEYRDSLRDGRRIHVNGEVVTDVTTHPMFKPLVDIRARIHDMGHDPARAHLLTWQEGDESCAIANKLPLVQADWWDKRRATDAILDAVGGVVTRIGDETVGEMWSLFDAQDVLNAIDPRFAGNIRDHIHAVVHGDPFHVSANTDPRGDRSRPLAEQSPDLAVHVVRETDAGIVVRGAKFETAAPYANQAFTKPAVPLWGDALQSDHALGFICDLGAPGLKFICRTGFSTRAPAEDYPLSARFDEIDALVVFDDVLVPWENVLFYRHTRAAQAVQACLHRYSAFAFLQRILRHADLLIGTALLALRQTGLAALAGPRDKLTRLAVWREGINAHLTAAITLAERSPAGLLMPNQSLLYAGRLAALDPLAQMVHLTRELCGGHIALTPDAAAFRDPATADWLERLFAIGPDILAEDRRRLLAFARDLINSDHAGHRLTFQLFAQSPPHAQLAALYRAFDWDGPQDLVRAAAGMTAPAPDGGMTAPAADSGEG